MMRHSVLAAILLAATIPNASALTQQHNDTQQSEIATDVSAQQRVNQTRRPARPAPVASGQIACTQNACFPVPPGCTPTTGFNGFGDPTGNDVVVCR
jgi:hypothetical protein